MLTTRSLTFFSLTPNELRSSAFGEKMECWTNMRSVRYFRGRGLEFFTLACRKRRLMRGYVWWPTAGVNFLSNTTTSLEHKDEVKLIMETNMGEEGPMRLRAICELPVCPGVFCHIVSSDEVKDKKGGNPK